MPWALRGLRNGVVTTGYPRRHDEYADTFAARVVPVDRPEFDPELAALCPTSAIVAGPTGLAVDQGRCILCMRCVDARPDLVGVRAGSETAKLASNALVVPVRPGSDAEVADVRESLRQRNRAFGRSVHIRHVDLGSDGSDEWEVQALLNPYYDVQRLGIFFTASPKHADIVLVTGVGAEGMREPLRRTLEVVPRPYVVIATGADAVSGGLVGATYASTAGVGALMPDGEQVDVWVPGSPAPPFALLHGILLALGRMTESGESR